MLLPVFAAPAQQWSFTDTGGTVTMGSDLVMAGTSVASPSGVLSLSCPATALPPGTYSAEWICTGGSLTIQSNDGLTAVNAALTSGTFIETAYGGGRGHPTTYDYVFSGTFTGTLTLSGQAQAITGSTVQSLAGSTSQLGTGTIYSGLTYLNTQYEPLFIADTYNNRIVRMDSMAGANWITFGSHGAGTNKFQLPWGIAVDAAGKIYVTDGGNCRVVRIDDMSGANWTSLGHCGSGSHQFNNPTGLFVDAAGNIYVADTGNNRIVRVNDIAGDGWKTYGAAGSGTGQFASPEGVAVDAAGKIYVADMNNFRLVRMDDISGANWTAFGAYGSGVNQFSSPLAVSLDHAGKIYVADMLQNRIVRIDDMSGANWTVLGGTLGAGVGQFINPYGVFVDPYGTIFVADSHDNRIVLSDDMLAGAWTPFGAGGTGAGFFNLPTSIVAAPPTVPTPVATLSATSLSYGDTVVGTSSAAQTVTLANIGTAPLSISGIAASGDFSQTNTCAGTLPAGQTCVVTVAFAPSAAGSRTGSVAFNFASSSKTVSLAGIASLVAVSPTALNFGTVKTSDRGTSLTVTVSNPGVAAAGISSVTLKAAAVYRVSNACPATLPVGASCSVKVTFTPQTNKYYTGTLTVTDASGVAQQVAITGTGGSN